jgi:tellurite resistance protein TehA-like permease
VTPATIHIRANKQRVKNLDINKIVLLLYALIFLNLGCISAYFEFDFYAIILWIIGSAIMNIFVFVISYRKL